MKKLTLGLMFLLFSLTSTIAQNQNLQEWTWDEYKVKFKAPMSMKVTANDSEKFQAENDNFSLNIFPVKGETIGYERMKARLKTWAREAKLSFEGEPDYMEDLNGYWGTFIDGSFEGAPTTILLLIDPDFPDINLYIWLTYNPDKIDRAVAILKSFTPN